MKIAIFKSKLKIIYTKLVEFREEREIINPKPEFERLFMDFKDISKQLKGYNPEIFVDLNDDISPVNKSAVGFSGRSYSIYNKSSLELLLFEVEKATSYISILVK